MIKFIMSKSGLTIFGGDASHSIAKDHPKFDELLAKCVDPSTSFEDIESLISLKTSIESFKDGEFTVEGDQLKFKGRSLPAHLSERLIALLRENGNIDPFYNFLINLFQNPSFASVEELYGFLEVCNLPITPEGHFLAYKKVAHSYKDLHSGTFDNSVSKVVEMARNEVDDNRNQTCSKGLHVCSYEYLSNFGGTGLGDKDDRVVICKVNPKDVVSVPSDYNNQKMRVCSYQVVDEIPNDGMTKIMSWTYGNRKENWIRDTLATLRTMITDILTPDFEVKFDTQLFTYRVSEAKIYSFLEKVVEEFDLSTLGIAPLEFIRERFINKYEKKVTLENLLQFVSNYAAE